MQPTIICTAPVPGMIYLNGRFAGEASRERPLFAPVAPGGAAYLEYRPLTGGGALARRCVFSDGAPLAESLENADGLSCVAWPGGVLEVEFAPVSSSVERFAVEGVPCAIDRGERTALTFGGLTQIVPDGAQPPRLLREKDAAALLGEAAGGGQYLVALSPGLDAPLGILSADRIDPAGGGMFSAITALGDSVGHGRLEQWLLDGSGLHLASVESVWSAGAPAWPQTAEATMIAAVEAALAGLPGERPCVGLLKAENAHLAAVRPLYYRAEPAAGLQGPWQITWLSLE